MWRPFDCPSARWTRSGQRQLIGLQPSLKTATNAKEGAMRPLVRCSGRGRLLAVSCLHVRAQVGPGALGALVVAGLIGAAVALMLRLMLAGSARSHMVIMAGLAISTVSGAA